MIRIFLISIFLLSFAIFAQEKSAVNTFDDNVKHAYTNAMKGIYFALENIPESKSSLNSDLIEEDDLLAEIKLSKEIDGVKIESKGYYNTYSVEVIVYRSYDSLEKDGYR